MKLFVISYWLLPYVCDAQLEDIGLKDHRREGDDKKKKI